MTANLEVDVACVGVLYVPHDMNLVTTQAVADSEVEAVGIDFQRLLCLMQGLEYPLDKFLGISISNNRTAFVWGEDLSDDEKTSIKSFFVSIGCKFID